MHEFKMGEAAAMIGVSADTVRRLADAGVLKTRRTRGGQRRVDGRSLAAYLAKQHGPNLRDVSSEQSMRNRLPGIVTRVIKDRVAAQVEIQVGPYRMVSLLTRESVEALGLQPGMLAIATVKSTNVSVEVPPSPGRTKP
jgi:molybdopterin-binding protein